MKMSDSTDWLMRPVLYKMALYSELKDGTLTLNDVARMNEAIDVKNENERRMQ